MPGFSTVYEATPAEFARLISERNSSSAPTVQPTGATFPGRWSRRFGNFATSLRSLEATPDAPDFVSSALEAALWLHAEVIRIHPFEDGNGRAGRALLNLILVRLGLRPLAFEAPKQEYISCLNHYCQVGDVEPLLDLSLRLYEFD